MKRSTQVVGNSGLCSARYALSQRGWNVMPTARNARGIDIIAYDADATSSRAFQVKALSIATEPQPFILTSAEVKARARRLKKATPGRSV